ncbi:MAG: hypothetical protein SFV23_07645 [Planctomycetaceae bacterium]|nr:hypothetical protein [Planctomycetaceae bacterium]
MSLIRLLCGCGALIAGQASAEAAPPAAPVSQLVVDVVMLKQGKPLRGAVVEQQADGSVLMVVSESWLKAHDSQRYAVIAQDDAKSQQLAWRGVLDRIELRLSEPLESPRLKFFLEQERARLSKQRQAPPKTHPFLWISLPRGDVARVVQPTSDRQRLGIIAWYADLADVEIRSAAGIRKELLGLDFALDGPLPDLGARLPPREQNDVEWNARLAIVEYGLTDPMDFQGTGETLIRTAPGLALDWHAILPGFLEQQTQRLLDELVGVESAPASAVLEATWLKPAISEARQLSRRGFRVTRVAADPDAGKVIVDARFVARLGDDTWRTIWASTHTADSAKTRPELEDKIAADPQVRTILRTVQALNVGSDEIVKQAIRHGAATMDAQAAADTEFYRFRDRYLQRLDGPYLPVAAP